MKPETRAGCVHRPIGAIALILCTLPARAAEPARQQAIRIVTQIQRADYEGDRAALKRLAGELERFVNDQQLSSRVLYWRAFAMWRRAINGFNDSVDPQELEQDLILAMGDFERSAAKDPGFADAKIGAGSCASIALGLHRDDPVRMRELLTKAAPLLKEAQAASPDSPRLLWVLGPNLWWSPPERGGGQEKSIAAYEQGLAAARKRPVASSDPLDPSWGEAELLMSLAWAQLNRTTPDVNAAEQYARSALHLVPYWHYVRDILMPQILEAKAKR
jgi:hypothetical protein